MTQENAAMALEALNRIASSTAPFDGSDYPVTMFADDVREIRQLLEQPRVGDEVKTFRTWLDEEIELARIDEKESHKAAMNSYGAGYDGGVVRGLIMVRNYFTGECE